LVETVEEALIEYMKNHPLEGTPIVIQNQIKSSINDKLKILQISLIEKPLRLYMTRLTDGDGDPDFLRKNISKEVKRGIKIKTPPPEFLALLMEADKLI